VCTSGCNSKHHAQREASAGTGTRKIHARGHHVIHIYCSNISYNMLLPQEVKELYTENLTRSWHFSGKRSTDLGLEYDDSIVPSMDRDRLQLQYKVTNMLNKPSANKEWSICTGLEPFTCRKHLVKKKNPMNCTV
jgi:hypothetical protein